ncbi:MAG: V4R domain-containing protein [Promethearchaeota archaeon]
MEKVRMPELDRVDRPNLGESINIRLFRALSLFSLRDVVGEDASKTLAYAGGKALGRRTKFKEFEEFLQWLEKNGIARVKSFTFDSEKGIGNLVLMETLSSAGLPNLGKSACSFETGLISGVIERLKDRRCLVREIRCHGKGDSECEFYIEVLDVPAYLKRM